MIPGIASNTLNSTSVRFKFHSSYGVKRVRFRPVGMYVNVCLSGTQTPVFYHVIAESLVFIVWF